MSRVAELTITWKTINEQFKNVSQQNEYILKLKKPQLNF